MSRHKTRAVHAVVLFAQSCESICAMDDIEFDAEAACEFALQCAMATQWGNRESGLILARWRRARRRRLHHGRLPRFVPNLDRIAEACYDADVEDEVEIDEASFFGSWSRKRGRIWRKQTRRPFFGSSMSNVGR